MDIKKARIKEVHWSIAWNASQQANDRIREVIGDTSKHFAKLKVVNESYNWMVDTVAKWKPMAEAPDDVKDIIMQKAENIRQEVYDKLADNTPLAAKICQVPNYNDYFFYRIDGKGHVEIVITGWGFHNFKQSEHYVDKPWTPRPRKKEPEPEKEPEIKPEQEKEPEKKTVVEPETEPEKEPEKVPVEATITVVDDRQKPFAGATVTIAQGAVKTELTLDEQGKATFIKDDFDLSLPVTATFSPSGESEQGVSFTLENSENQYLLQRKAQPKPSRIKEIIAAVLLAAALAAILLFVYGPGVDYLTNTINDKLS